MKNLIKVAFHIFTTICISQSFASDIWPSHSIKFIVGFGPGGANDLVARVAAEAASIQLGQPIIVENNGQRQTYLDNFIWNEKSVQVIYTNNNQHTFRSKGVNELMDIKEVIHRLGIHDTDMIIKLTGRYKVFSPIFFKYIINRLLNINFLKRIIFFFIICIQYFR